MPRSAGGVGIRLDASSGAGYDALCQCGSPWSCPVHAAVIGAERARESIAPVVRYMIDEVGGSVIHATFTVSHHGGMPLVETFDAVAKAWSALTAHRRWQNLDKAYGRMGFCRGAEMTWGATNGWHPHLHVLIFLRDEVDVHDAQKISDDLFEVYRAGLEREGYTLGREHGVRAELATTRRDAEGVLSRYLTKIASEITRQDKKSGKKAGRLAPFEILRAAHDADVLGDKGRASELLALWAEFEQATFGRKQLTWSGRWRKGDDIRTRAGVGVERTDQEIVDDADLGSQRVLVIPTGPEHEGNWARLRPHRIELLDVVETRGVGAATRWLDSKLITWQLPLDCAPWEGSDPEVVPELLRRDAHRVLRVPEDQLPRRRWHPDDADLEPTDHLRVRRLAWWSANREPEWDYVP